MSINNGDMPAMPVNSEQGSDIDYAAGSPNKYGMPTGLGLTKREHFAAMAMQGILSDAEYCRNLESDEIASMAVEQADQLLAALENKL